MKSLNLTVSIKPLVLTRFAARALSMLLCVPQILRPFQRVSLKSHAIFPWRTLPKRDFASTMLAILQSLIFWLFQVIFLFVL